MGAGPGPAGRRTGHPDDYPAHLHVDLLPAHRRSGHGRALTTAARAFYDRLGFHRIDVPGTGPLPYSGLEVGPNARLADSPLG
ncbi:hypothetical protein [Saccharothrix sp. 6-C]|uniref:hypothetical protein n=1 Tax=Saccharothrix sp. 6-C TaxID=2781735 RepID=UPI00191716D3|nr:hypothetical protein [Saccharothrix sp. 6-C]